MRSGKKNYQFNGCKDLEEVQLRLSAIPNWK